MDKALDVDNGGEDTFELERFSMTSEGKYVVWGSQAFQFEVRLQN